MQEVNEGLRGIKFSEISTNEENMQKVMKRALKGAEREEWKQESEEMEEKNRQYPISRERKRAKYTYERDHSFEGIKRLRTRDVEERVEKGNTKCWRCHEMKGNISVHIICECKGNEKSREKLHLKGTGKSQTEKEEITRNTLSNFNKTNVKVINEIVGELRRKNKEEKETEKVPKDKTGKRKTSQNQSKKKDKQIRKKDGGKKTPKEKKIPESPQYKRKWNTTAETRRMKRSRLEKG